MLFFRENLYMKRVRVFEFGQHFCRVFADIKCCICIWIFKEIINCFYSLGASSEVSIKRNSEKANILNLASHDYSATAYHRLLLIETLPFVHRSNQTCTYDYMDDCVRIIGIARSSCHLGAPEAVNIRTRKAVICRQNTMFGLLLLRLQRHAVCIQLFKPFSDDLLRLVADQNYLPNLFLSRCTKMYTLLFEPFHNWNKYRSSMRAGELVRLDCV